MKRILFITGQALGHAGRALMVARALQQTGRHDCIFTGSNSGGYLDKYVAPEGFEIRPLLHRDIDTSPAVYTQLLETIIEAVKPDMLVMDLSPLPWLSLVRLPAVPAVYLTNWFLTGLSADETVQDRIFASFSEQINHAREERGMAALNNARELYERDCVILTDPPALITYGDLPDHYHVAGAIWWEPEITLPDELKNARDLLFISMGSTGRDLPLALIEQLKQALSLNDAILVGTAARTVTNPPPPWTEYAALPGSHVLQRSGFCLTQGSAGSTWQALAAGVPVGCWPAHLNHTLLGKRLEALDAGVLFDPQDWENKLAQLQDNYTTLQAGAGRFRGMDAAAAAGIAADRITQLL